jgi:hypothetical protein
MKKPARNKHSSLFGPFVSDVEKKVYNTGTRALTHNLLYIDNPVGTGKFLSFLLILLIMGYKYYFHHYSLLLVLVLKLQRQKLENCGNKKLKSER